MTQPMLNTAPPSNTANHTSASTPPPELLGVATDVIIAATRNEIEDMASGASGLVQHPPLHDGVACLWYYATDDTPAITHLAITSAPPTLERVKGLQELPPNVSAAASAPGVQSYSVVKLYKLGVPIGAESMEKDYGIVMAHQAQWVPEKLAAAALVWLNLVPLPISF